MSTRPPRPDFRATSRKSTRSGVYAFAGRESEDDESAAAHGVGAAAAGVHARRPSGQLPFPLDRSEPVLFARARHAFWQGLYALGLQPRRAPRAGVPPWLGDRGAPSRGVDPAVLRARTDAGARLGGTRIVARATRSRPRS